MLQCRRRCHTAAARIAAARTAAARTAAARTTAARTHARRVARWRRLCSNSADCDTANGYSDKQHKVDKVHSNPKISFHMYLQNQ